MANRVIDLVGKRFGKLVVLEKIEKGKDGKFKWLCVCDCGNNCKVDGSSLRRGQTKSCGCIRKASYKNLIGRKFGRIYITSPSEKKTSSGNYIWNFICDCGNIGSASSTNLISGNVTSCGCYRLEIATSRIAEYNEAQGNNIGIDSGIHRAYQQYKKSAKSRNYVFDLTKEQFVRITSQNCFYCNKRPNIIMRGYVYNGIDRFYNALGYFIENCVPCCTECNKAKMNMDGHEYLALCRRVSEHWNSREMEERESA